MSPAHRSSSFTGMSDVPSIQLNDGNQIPQLGFGVFQIEPEDTDWDRIVALYDALAALSGNPVVELNRGMAVAMASGPEAGLEIVDELVAGGALDGYHLLPAVRGDLLEKLGRRDQARAEFELAASLTRNSRERDVLEGRASALAG